MKHQKREVLAAPHIFLFQNKEKIENKGIPLIKFALFY